MIKAVIFAAGTVGITLISWRSLRDWQAHGFYRFFAFESIMALILVNVDRWFADPFSLLQVISWVLLLSSLLMAAEGYHLLRVVGKPKAPTAGSTDMAFENTTKLVKVGAYKRIRHPLYASLLLLAWGAFFKDASSVTAGLLLLATLFLAITARVEEAENLKKFGEDYALYMKETRMFVPFIF